MAYSPEQIAQLKEIMEGVTNSSQEQMNNAMKEIAEANNTNLVKMIGEDTDKKITKAMDTVTHQITSAFDQKLDALNGRILAVHMRSHVHMRPKALACALGAQLV